MLSRVHVNTLRLTLCLSRISQRAFLYLEVPMLVPLTNFFNDMECLVTFSRPITEFIVSSVEGFIEGLSCESKVGNLDMAEFCHT